MPTLQQYVTDMLEAVPADALGRKEAITSLTTTTVVCSSMAFGTLTAERYKYKWLWRPDTATAADRFRLVSNFTASSGTFSHAGTNYADTTATGENVFILEYEPKLFIDAIQKTLDRIRQEYEFEVLLPPGGQRVVMPAELSWVTAPGQITSMAVDSSPQLTRNRYMEKWSTLQSTGGTLALDDWTLSGTGATLSRQSSRTYGGRRYAAAVGRNSNNAFLYQVLKLPTSGNTNWEGKTITFAARINCTDASTVRLQIEPYTRYPDVALSATNSSFHTGGDDWEELSVSYTVEANVDALILYISVITNDGTAYIQEAYAVEGSLTDGMRTDAYKATLLTKDDYVWNFPELRFENNISRGRLLVTSGRPIYPRFDSSRVLAGSADSDSSDAPLSLVSAGAIARMFEGLAQGQGNDTTRYRQIAAEWQSRFNKMAQRHRYKRDLIDGVDMPVRQFASSPRGW